MSLIVFAVFCASSAFAQEGIVQERKDSSPMILRGTSEILERPIVILPLTFVLNAPQTNAMLPLYQSFAGVPQSFAWEHLQSVDLTAPLKLQLYQSTTEKAIRITLGAAELRSLPTSI